MNLLYFISGATFFLGISLSIFKTPRSLAAAIVFLRGCLVSFISLTSSFWFSYVLFLVYVGGLLVIFIYVCLVRRNFPFRLNLSQGLFFLGVSVLFLFGLSSPTLKSSLGYSSWSSGTDLVENRRLSLFLFLAVLLLLILLVVVRRTGRGNLKVDA